MVERSGRPVAWDCVVRPAQPAEALALSELAFRSKASWGYSDAFMAACRQELTLTPQRMADWKVWAAQVDQTLVGMVALSIAAGPGLAELEHFFVDPAFQGRGVGTVLISAAVDACRLHGVARIGLDADPNAEVIYQRLGFSTVGRAASKSFPGRTLPRMELRLA